MPARVETENLFFTAEQTLQMIRETGLASFRLRLFRGIRSSLHIATFETATLADFEHASAWIYELCGGGTYQLEASRLWDSRFEPDLIRPIGSRVSVVIDGHERDVDLGAPTLLQWRGPQQMTYPVRGTMVETVAAVRVPALKEPLRSVTIGYNPEGPLMMPSYVHAGYFDRMYLFGAPSEPPSPLDHDFSFGQRPQRTMPGIVIRVGGHRAGHYALEVIRASSQGHVEGTLLEAQGKLIEAVHRHEETADLMVQLYMALERLKTMPLFGYVLNPVIGFLPSDDIRIEGVPKGMRLYLTGVAEEVR